MSGVSTAFNPLPGGSFLPNGDYEITGNWRFTGDVRFGASSDRAVPIAAFGGVDVRLYDAKGDGVTDDTAAIRVAIAAAGVGGQVNFPAGKTFLTSGVLTLLAGQTVYGYGSTLKRRAAASSATATAISAGPSTTSLIVADGTLFREGMDVTVYNGGTYDPQNHQIRAVRGNVLTLATAFTQAFASGGTVISSHTQMYSAAEGVSVLGLRFDGNKANNTGLTKWENHKELYLASDRGVIRDVSVVNAQAEAIVVGGVGPTVNHCFIDQANGNGIHLSGTESAVVTENYVRDVNLAGSVPGHADGCIIFSNSTGDSLIVGNYCENGISGIGSIDSDDNSSQTIGFNVVRSCTTYGLEMIVSDVNAGKVTITGNKFYDCGPVSIYNNDTTPAANTGPYRLLLTGNYFEATRVDIRRAFDLVFTGNQVFSPGTQTGIAVNLYYLQRALVSGNQISGYQYGFYVDGAAGSEVPLLVSLHGNTFIDQYTNAIRFNVASLLGVSANHNHIYTTSGYASATYAGIQLQNGVTANGNVMHLLSGQYGILCPNGGSGVAGAIVSGNVIRSSGLTASIRTNGGSQNNVITGNFVQQAISDGGSPNNTVSGITTIL